MSDQFVHLHTHTHYSLLDGAIKIPDLAKAAADYGMPAIGMTDHGNMFGALEFYKECKKVGVKPIIGYEAYMAPRSRFDKNAENKKAFHLTLLAQNYTGYKNLMKIATEAYLNGFYYKPRIDKEFLSAHSEGLIAFSGCLASEICRNLVNKREKEAYDTVAYYRDVFKDNFYIEFQENKIGEQTIANQALLKAMKEFDLPAVFTNDIHYLRKNDAKPHDVLLCIQTAAKVQQENRFRFGSQEFYLKSSEQMHREAAPYPGSAQNTLLIAEKVNIEIPLGQILLPRFDAPDGKTNEEYFRELCENGLRKRYGEIEGEVKERFDMEFEVIKQMGFPSYFLIVWDFINYARTQGIPVGPGRGSAAGSIIAYALGITNLDPLKYGLIFERFLNAGRQEMPDIDIDFETERRGEVIEYVTQKYGKDQVAQIITFGTMAARGVVRDVGRAMDTPLSEVDKVAKKIPPIPKMTLEKALATEEEFRQVYESDPTIKELVDIAKRLEGLNRQPGLHAAGVIISDAPLIEYCPLYKNTDGVIATQYSMEHMESIGLLKMDFLGLSTLSLIQKTVEYVNKYQKVDLDIDKMPTDNQETYDLLIRGETAGVFQLESSGMRELVKKLKPDRFEDIIALVALYRPGPLQSGMVDTYCRCKHGEEEPSYSHPVMEEILTETYGMILYQEQAMQIAKDLAGFSLVEADRLRKAMGKKKKDLMDAYRKQFIDGSKKTHDINPKLAGEIFDLIDYFSGYGFNKSHSAAYALVTYQTAYLKALYPKEFMCALMTIENQNTDKIVRYIQECEAMKIEVLPANINTSLSEFTVEGDKVRFGLCAVKGAGEKALEELVTSRKEVEEFSSLFHLCESVDTRVMNKQVLEALIKCGSMDSFGKPRRQLFEAVPSALQLGGNLQRQRNSDQMNLFDEVETEDVAAASEHLYPDVSEWPDPQKLKYEKESLGFYYSGHPLQKWNHYIKMLGNLQLEDLSPQVTRSLLVGGMISAKRDLNIKKGRHQGRKMSILQLEDFSGHCSMICFPDTYQKYYNLLEIDKIVFIRGSMNKQKDETEIIIDEVIPIEEAIERLSKTLILRVEDHSLESVTQLHEACSMYRGDIKTLIEVKDQNYVTQIEVAEKYYLRADVELFDKIEKILGNKAICCLPQ